MNIYDQLKQLWARVTGLEKSNESLAPLIPKIPKDYSSAKTDTGVKWYTGQKIYCVVLTAVMTSNNVVIDVSDYDMALVIRVDGSILSETNLSVPFGFYASGSTRFNGYLDANNKQFIVQSASTYAGRSFDIAVYYVENESPSKSTEDDEPETKATKATKKKATK